MKAPREIEAVNCQVINRIEQENGCDSFREIQNG
jgi:hypothetical protein